MLAKENWFELYASSKDPQETAVKAVVATLDDMLSVAEFWELEEAEANVTRDPDNDVLRMTAALHHMARRRFGPAIHELGKLIDKFPLCAELYFRLGTALLYSGRLTECIRQTRKGLIQKHDAVAHAQVAYALHLMGKNDLALREVEMAWGLSQQFDGWIPQFVLDALKE